MCGNRTFTIFEVKSRLGSFFFRDLKIFFELLIFIFSHRNIDHHFSVSFMNPARHHRSHLPISAKDDLDLIPYKDCLWRQSLVPYETLHQRYNLHIKPLITPPSTSRYNLRKRCHARSSAPASTNLQVSKSIRKGTSCHFQYWR